MEKFIENNIFTDLISRKEFTGLFSLSEKPEQWFTPKELQSFGMKKLSGSLAARYLVKKRIGNTLGTDAYALEMEILNDPYGKPTVDFSKTLRVVLEKAGIQSVQCSLSHSRNYITSLTVIICDGF